MTFVPNSMYTSHPKSSALKLVAKESLVDAVEKQVSVSFADLLAMRRVVERLATAIRWSQPDLVPFFATGGIPFVLPAMHALSRLRMDELLRGKHFHMFPGLSWGGKLGGLNSESFFAKEFGNLIADHAKKKDRLRVFTMDATFTGNAIRKLLTSMYAAFEQAGAVPKDSAVSIIAVIDASRAKENKKRSNSIVLYGPKDDINLSPPSEFEPIEVLQGGSRCKFRRKDGKDLFALEIEYWVMDSIPTEDKADLIGAKAAAKILGVESKPDAGRFTVEFSNKLNSTGTGGNGLAANLMNWLSQSEDNLPWCNWIEAERAAPVQEEEGGDYAESRRQGKGGLTIYELLISQPSGDEVVKALTKQRKELSSEEIYCLTEVLKANSVKGGVPVDVVRRAIGASKKDASCIQGTLEACRLFDPKLAALIPKKTSPCDELAWWDAKLPKVAKWAAGRD
jgi:hypothetical protein